MKIKNFGQLKNTTNKIKIQETDLKNIYDKWKGDSLNALRIFYKSIWKKISQTL